MKKIVVLLIGFSLYSCMIGQVKENDILISEDQKNYHTEVIVDGIQNPWGMCWLQDGSMLITEIGGELIHFKDGKKILIENVPKVVRKGQGGLLDIETHPNFKQNGWIYITYSSGEGLGKGQNTALIRAKLKGNSLVEIEKIYKAAPNSGEVNHFGSRVRFDNDGFVFLSIGDRYDRDINPQDITKDGGKIYRLHDDGRIPSDNPFVNEKNAKKAIYSYGHRNPQGMVLNQNTNQIWIHEHGPKGGDEINVIKKGANYGWPTITYGVNYSGTSITDETSRPGMEQPLYYWVPSIAPSGMDFVNSPIYPNWNGNLLVGSLKFQYLEMLTLSNDKVIGREKLLDKMGRVRNVRQGPDGYIYVAIENEGIVKIIPK